MKKGFGLILSFVLLFSCISITPASGAAGTKTLTFITDAVYDDLWSLSDGLALVYKDGEYQYIDENCRVVLGGTALRSMLLRAGLSEDELINVQFYSFNGGLGLAYVDNATTIFFDKTGKVVMKNEYTYQFSEGYARTKGNDLGVLSLINAKGETVAEKDFLADTANTEEHMYDFGSQVHDGLIEVWEYADYNSPPLGAGYVNTKLEAAIPFEFQSVRPFSNGRAFVMQDDKWGVIDTKGQFVIKPQFGDFWVHDSIYDYMVFAEGLAAVEKDGKWGFIDETGNTAVPFDFVCDDYGDAMGFFKEGLAFIAQDGKYGYIDTEGSIVVPFIYDNANFMNNGVALVGSGGSYKIIDNKGNTVSAREWILEGCFSDYNNPDFIGYVRDGKWGVAKIADAASDMPSGWAVSEIDRATKLGLVTELFTSGYGFATTRVEFCALAARLYEKLEGEEIAVFEEFSDTTDINVEKLAGLGIVDGVGGGRFNPDDRLTREQAATIIARLMDKLDSGQASSSPDFTDNGNLAPWSREAVGLVQRLKIMNGRDDGSFDPKGSYTREQCIVTMLRAYDVCNG